MTDTINRYEETHSHELSAARESGYVVYAVRFPGIRPDDLELRPELEAIYTDDLERWSLDHLRRFHGWDETKIAEERQARGASLHDLEHAYDSRGDDPYTPPSVAVAHTHATGMEIAIELEETFSREVRDALLAIVNALPRD